MQEKLINESINQNGVIQKTYTSRNLNLAYLFLLLLGGVGIAYAYGGTPSALIMCQNSYMKATNEIVRYNEENPNYKIELPKYNCTETLIQKNATGGNAPEPLGQEINKLELLYDKICKKQPSSPLCKDKALFYILNNITEERLPGKNFFPILIGITSAESSLGLDFAKDNVGGFCSGRNNWGGTKYQIHDDNTRTYSRHLNGFLYGQEYTSRFADQFGCNLYPFESIEEFWITKVNGIRYGYKGCIDSPTPIKCISYAYVGKPKVSERSWVENVSEFLID